MNHLIISSFFLRISMYFIIFYPRVKYNKILPIRIVMNILNKQPNKQKIHRLNTT